MKGLIKISVVLAFTFYFAGCSGQNDLSYTRISSLEYLINHELIISATLCCILGKRN